MLLFTPVHVFGGHRLVSVKPPNGLIGTLLYSAPRRFRARKATAREAYHSIRVKRKGHFVLSSTSATSHHLVDGDDVRSVSETARCLARLRGKQIRASFSGSEVIFLGTDDWIGRTAAAAAPALIRAQQTTMIAASTSHRSS